MIGTGLLITWLTGFGTCWLWVWAAARRERIAAEESDRRIEAEDAERAEYLRQLRAHEDELAYFRSQP